MKISYVFINSDNDIEIALPHIAPMSSIKKLKRKRSYGIPGIPHTMTLYMRRDTRRKMKKQSNKSRRRYGRKYNVYGTNGHAGWWD
jgi:hypothetical protein